MGKLDGDDVIVALSEKLAYLREAEEILSDIWLELGPYHNGKKISDDVWNRLGSHFDFDDSE